MAVNLDIVIDNIKRVIRRIFIICMMAAGIIYLIYSWFTKYERPIRDNNLIIVEDSNGARHLYKDRYPTYSVLLGKTVKEINCFKNVHIKDTIRLLTKNNNYYHIVYDITGNIDKNAFNDYSIDFIEYANSNYNEYIKDVNNEIKYLFISVPAVYGDKAEEYLANMIKTDIKSILTYNAFKVKKMDVDLIND